MAAISEILSELYAITIAVFTVAVLEVVLLARSIKGIIQETKNKPINTKKYLKILEQKNPSSVFKKARIRTDDSSMGCTVCLSQIQVGDTIRKLKCKHVFHRDCLDRWLLLEYCASCPLCRTRVLPADVIDKYRRFLIQQKYGGGSDDEELIFLGSSFDGNFIRRLY